MGESGALIIVVTMVVIFLAIVSLMCARAIRSAKDSDLRRFDLEESIREQETPDVASGNHD